VTHPISVYGVNLCKLIDRNPPNSHTRMLENSTNSFVYNVGHRYIIVAVA